MGYYGRGDYYRGDYYRGDFWNTLKHIGSGIVDVATGNIGGALAQGAAIFGGGSSGPPSPPGTSLVATKPRGKIYNSSPIPLVDTGRRLLGETVVDPSQGVPRGYHVSKKTGKIVRNRHMNPLNVKALRRADRRASSFLRITRHVVKHYTPKLPKGKAYVHFKRKK